MKNNKLNYRLINLTALMLFLYIAVTNISAWIGIFTRIIQIILPFIIAFTIAYALTPVVRKLEKNGLPKWLAVTLIVLLFVGLLVFLLITTLPLIYDQLLSLSNNLSDILENVSDKFNLNLGSIEGNIENVVNDLTTDVGNIIGKGLSKSIGVIGDFIVSFVATIYFLSYMDSIRSKIKIFLKRTNMRMFNYIASLDLELGNYIKGLMIFMVVQFAEYSILFRIVNHPNWLLLGILACITTVIPYFGGLITNIIALIFASVSSPFTFIGTLIICIIFPQLDGYIISPKIYGKTNNINPLITIMAVSVGGTIAGAIGIVASLPVYILLKCTYDFFEKDLKEKINDLRDAI